MQNMDDYNRIKNHLNACNWHLESDEFYNLIDGHYRTREIGYKLNFGQGSETDDYFSLHFYMMETDLSGEVWLKKSNYK